MDVILPTISVPGFAEATKLERKIRDHAFLGGNEIVAGVVVRQLSLRTVLYLEHAQNGFIIRFNFDDRLELLAHALQALFFSTPTWKAPEVNPYSFWRSMLTSWRHRKFQRSVMWKVSGEEIIEEVREWVNEAFMDCPSGEGSGGQAHASYASYPAHLVDLFGAAGLQFTFTDIMDMPLKQLWQHWRLAANRVYDVKLTNPSDNLAVEHIGKVAA